jgi:alkanesulfonate monooxygenase SsuD/methylene tetrahydromethanopterin reductase-like flavin-dependent oxidoreductase (luciferase family)
LKIGLYYDLRNPPQWRRPWSEFYARSLELVEEADRLGADSVWLSEHHFFEDGYLPQTLTFAAAVAARTKRARIGTAVLLAPLRSAVQIAEDAAIVDLVSDGRLELGLGAGYVVPEFEAFAADRSRRYTTTDARVREIRALFSEGKITPPPVQDPLPIWLGYQGPQGAERAGKLGTGLLSLNPKSLAPYREGLRAGGHDPASARMSGVLGLIVADDPEATREAILPHIAWQLNTYRQGAAAGSGKSAREITVDELRDGYRSSFVPVPEVCTADAAVARIRELTADLPVEHVYLWASIAGMPDAISQRHMELVCSHLRPALAGD